MRSSRRTLLATSSLALSCAAAGAWAVPQTASACGGTFCDAGPQAMPVDQTGENILFVMEGGYTEAHIQIQYDPETEAEGFAWVVPVTVVPEFSVGSERLFQNILDGTVPRYGFQTVRDDCSQPDSAPDNAGGGDDGGSASFDAGASDSGGPEVVLKQTVGAFDIVVLSGGTASEVMAWLGDNGYQQDPAAEPIIADYLQEGLLFAAFKLRVGAEASEVHPVVLRFPDLDEACIPLRLTRIAASDDMDVRAFFLSDDRVVPQNYRHVLVNPLKIDWPSLGANYKEVITLAVDALGADGRAFVTEYAGSSLAVDTSGLHDSQWDAARFTSLSTDAAISELGKQNLLQCEVGSCEFGHPLIEGLLAEYMPAPDGVENEEYWGCPYCFTDPLDPPPWDAEGFSAALAERLIDPGAHAQALLDAFPYLTRMYTTISPGEMTVDPLFHQNSSLPDVAASRTATRRVVCNGDEVWTLPDGREVYLPAGAPWPEFEAEMPWEEDIDEVPDSGAPFVVVDRTAEIDAMLAEYNAGVGWPGGGAGEGEGTGGSSGTGEGEGGTGGPGLDEDREVSGCACSSLPGRGAPLGLMLGLALFGVRRRR